MNKAILLFIIPILIGLSNVSADETGTGTNSSPVAVDDTTTTNEDTLVEINLTWNDTDIDLDTLTVTWISSMLNGTWVINSSWTWVIFTPELNFNWTWSFDYIVSDWELTDTWSVLITVNSVNDMPVAVDDAISIDENTTVDIDLVSNDTDVEGDNLTVTTLWTILNWTWVINSYWTWVIFTPNTDFKWMVSFVYTVSDWTYSDVWTVSISVSEENIFPVAVNDTLITKENTEKTIDPTLNDTDANWDVLDIISITEPLHWEATFTSISVTYMPDTDYYWADSFTYTVNDGSWWTDIWTINVTVNEDDDDDDDNDDDDDDDDNDDDYGWVWYKFRERHMVQAVQKEFIAKFKALKNRYKGSRWRGAASTSTYLRLKNELRTEYLLKLREVTWQAKKYGYEWDSVKLNYKNTYKNKYWSKISTYSDSKLESIVEKIDDMIAEVNESNRSDETKARLNTMLLALRELVIEYIDNDDDILDIDSLFE